MERTRLFFCALFLCLAGVVSAQTIRVTGTVKDSATGEGIPYASVMVKGTMNGTASNGEGAYTINAPSDGTLVFSAIGYVTVIQAVNGNGVIDISLDAEAESLDDVVLVAYGTAKKSSFTGSAGTVKSESIQKRTVSNVSKAIEGLVAGVTSTSGSGQPGEGASILIRGTGSINASSSPLYVVDGIPFDGTLSSLNPNDIEALTVLKDASASALYGARAANGVVLITTKRGSEGRAVVNFKATVGFQSRSVQDYDVVNQKQWTELTWEALKNDFMINGEYSDADARRLASEKIGASVGGEQYNPYKGLTWDKVIDPSTGKLSAGAKSVYNEKWLDAITNDSAIHQEYQISVNGGDKKTKYAFSAGYLDDKGVLIETGFKRYSVRANVDHTVNDWMQLGANINYAYTKQNASQYGSTQTGNAWYTAQFMAPVYPVYLRDDKGALLLDEFGKKQYDYGETGRPKAAKFNVVGDMKANIYENVRDNTGARAYATFGGDSDAMGIFKGLSLSTNFGADISNYRNTNYYNPYHGDGASTNGSISKSSSRTFSYTWNQILKYERTFNKTHVLGQLGHEFYNYEYSSMSGEKSGVYPGIAEMAPATNVSGTNSYSQKYKIESYFARLAADYADKYYLEATWRTDGSSRFNEDNRWGQFWSLGGSWRVSEEPFLKHSSWIDNLTVRASYGELGNDSIGSYYAWQSFYDLTYANANLPGAVVSSLANPKVSWEKKGSFNTGIEGTFFHKFLNLTLEYYNAKTSDMLLSFPMATSTGFNGYNSNVGSMRNQGFEGTARFNWVNRSDFRISSTLMAYLNRNKVIKLTDSDRITSGNQVIEVGKPIYTFYMPKAAGVDPENGKLLYWAYKTDDNGDKIEGSDYKTDDSALASSSKYYRGSREPKLQGSFGTDLQWKGLDFSFLTTFSFGGKVWDSVYGGTMEVSYAGDTWNKNALKRWQKPGDKTDVPVLLLGSKNISADRWLVNASYFAIKSIQLGYTFPSKWMNKAHIRSLRLFATADNVALFTKLKGLNPQYSTSGGTDYAYTPTRTISVGIDINF